MTRIDELNHQISVARADICELACLPNTRCGEDGIDPTAEILKKVDLIVKLSIERDYWLKKQ